jgi:hypothetical protein
MYTGAVVLFGSLPLQQSIEWFKKDQVFSLSNDSAPPQPPATPLSRHQVVSLTQSDCV